MPEAVTYGMARKPLATGLKKQRDQQRLAKLREKALSRNNFYKWRMYCDKTLEEAAEASGLSVGTISALERDMQGYTDDSLGKLAKAYNTTPGQLLDVDPFEAADLLMMWSGANQAQRGIILRIARGVLSPEKD